MRSSDIQTRGLFCIRNEDEGCELLRTNGTKDGVSMLAVLYALQFYK